jgi:hypothetical protein
MQNTAKCYADYESIEIVAKTHAKKVIIEKVTENGL